MQAIVSKLAEQVVAEVGSGKRVFRASVWGWLKVCSESLLRRASDRKVFPGAAMIIRRQIGRFVSK